MELLEKQKGLKSPSEITPEMLQAIVDYVTDKQWIKDHFPKIEEEVLIIVEHRPFMRPVQRRVVRAFYEDGTLPEMLSRYFWDLSKVATIPAGWYEAADYGEISEISDPVIGWQNLPDPWEGDAG